MQIYYLTVAFSKSSNMNPVHLHTYSYLRIYQTAGCSGSVIFIVSSVSHNPSSFPVCILLPRIALLLLSSGYIRYAVNTKCNQRCFLYPQIQCSVPDGGSFESEQEGGTPALLGVYSDVLNPTSLYRSGQRSVQRRFRERLVLLFNPFPLELIYFFDSIAARYSLLNLFKLEWYRRLLNFSTFTRSVIRSYCDSSSAG